MPTLRQQLRDAEWARLLADVGTVDSLYRAMSKLILVAQFEELEDFTLKSFDFEGISSEAVIVLLRTASRVKSKLKAWGALFAKGHCILTKRDIAADWVLRDIFDSQLNFMYRENDVAERIKRGESFESVARRYMITVNRARQLYLRPTNRDSVKRRKYVETHYARSGAVLDHNEPPLGTWQEYTLGAG